MMMIVGREITPFVNMARHTADYSAYVILNLSQLVMYIITKQLSQCNSLGRINIFLRQYIIK